MFIPGKLTDAEIVAVARSTRSLWYWPRLIASNLYGLLLLLAALWAIVAGDRQHRQGRLILLAVIAGLFAWAYFSTRRQTRKDFSNMKTAMPDKLELTSSGLRSIKANGATGFTPWTAFKGWQQMGTVFRLDLVEGKSFSLLPSEGLSVTEREALRDLLARYLLRTGPDR